ncbi:MAG: ankyrin repeat domain-containing protein [Synergistaceae bacterium]|nr:ankyrin repeat domain-containing protein [Synergistaceae bacterium]
MNRLSLITRLAELAGVKMWQKLPEEFFFTTLTPPETDEIVLSLVKAGALSPSTRDPDGSNLLHITVQKVYEYPERAGYYINFVRELVKAGAHVDSRSPSGDTPLCLALSNRKPSCELVRTLLELGAYVNRVTAGKFTALQIAVMTSCPEAVRLLVDAGANVNLHEYSSSPLTLALDNNNSKTPEIAKILVDAGADSRDILLQLMNSQSPNMELVNLFLASGTDAGYVLCRLRLNRRLPAEQLISRTELLLDAGADINSTCARSDQRYITNSQTILHRAVYDMYFKCPPEYIQMLISRGASVNVQDREGYTPLMSACVRERGINIITLLLDAGAELDVQTKNGETALYFAAGKDDLDVMKLLLERGANPNITDKEGNTPLMKAIISHTEAEFAEALLDAGADPNIVNAEGDTALTLALARRADSLRIALSLVTAGADPGFVRVKGTGKREKGFDGETALMILARHCYKWDTAVIAIICMMKYNPETKEMDDLDSVPAFVNAQDSNGDTALIKAVRDNRSRGWWKKDLIDTLLLCGCDKDIVNKEGKKAVDYAKTQDIIKLLQ